MVLERELKRRMRKMIIALIIVFGVIFGFDYLRSKVVSYFMGSYQPPPVTVSATYAKATDWHPQLFSIGTLSAENGTMISPEVAGIVAQIYFTSGQVVKKGAPLIKINDATDQAQLQNYQAALKLAQLNYQRALTLFQEKAGAKADLDSAQSTLSQAQANVNQTQALIAEKNIVAPFNGRLGINLVNVGQYVSLGTPIVSLQAFYPLRVNFWLPEQNLQQIHLGGAVEIQSDAFPGKTFAGTITAINSEVDTQTHNLEIQATIPNSDSKLIPGLFVNVRVVLPAIKNVIVVPQTAVTFSLYGNTVFIVTVEGKDKKEKPILKVHQTTVTLGEQHNNQVVIEKGLKVGDQIVTSGQLKLTEGAPVVINNDIKL